jgi:hypothetical protein
VGLAGVPLPAAVAAAALLRASDPAAKALIVLALALWSRLPVRIVRAALQLTSRGPGRMPVSRRGLRTMLRSGRAGRPW